MTDIASSPLDTDLCVHVDRRVDHPVGHVWGVVNSPQGVEAWLGSGAKLGGKGEHWYAADGSQGVLRSYHPAEQIRVSWHASDEAPASLVDLHIVPDGAGTRLDLAQHCIAHKAWEPALEQLLEIVRIDRKFGDDIGRKTMIQVFDLASAQPQLVAAWRRKLSSVLF